MAGLDAEQRTTLDRLVVSARVLLENDLAAQAEGRFGIHLDGTVENESALPDDSTLRITRRDLDQIMAHLQTTGDDAPGAVTRLIREAVFTHLNRLVAIRIAEAVGLLTESLAKGPQSRGFRDLAEIMPMLADDYRAYLHLCGDELAADAPALFDPRNPLLALEPSNAALDELVALFADPSTDQIWSAPDTLGWVYQFFNDRSIRTSAAPRDSNELAIRNQFFTPRYVVDYLVQNTLGRRLVEADPTTELLEDLDLLVDPPTSLGSQLDLDQATMLDPACGSGHFLLGCYDLLERAWECRGVRPDVAAPRIVDALWGIDIDPRCAQVASAAIMLRARRHCRDAVIPAPHIVTARPVPRGAALDALLEDLDVPRRRLVERMVDALDAAPELGSLLKAEELLGTELRRAVFGSDRVEGTLAESLPEHAFSDDEHAVSAALARIGDSASASPSERLFAAEGRDAIRFVEAMGRRYDVVLMNPPFGEPIPSTKPYLKTAYPWIPWKDYNLLGAFVGRGMELLAPHGYLGAITSRTGFYLASFEQWRRDVLLANRFVSMVDLGSDVMEGAMVEAAAYVIANEPSSDDDVATFIRLLKETKRSEALHRVVASINMDDPPDIAVRVRMREIEKAPAAIFVYWDPSGLRSHLTELPPLEGASVQARVGLQTSDDPRFIRAAWEVDPRRCTTDRGETHRDRPWVPLGKGGEYSPYYSDFELVVNWGNDGAEIRAFDKAVVRNQQHYFMPGVTWPERTVSGFAPQICPPGVIFSVVGPLCRVDDERERFLLLAWLNSRPVRWVIESTAPAGEETKKGGTAARHYTVGGIQRMPWIGPRLDADVADRVAVLAAEIALMRAGLDECDETTRRFIVPSALLYRGPSLADCAEAHVRARQGSVLEILEHHSEIDSIFLDVLGAVPGRDLDASVGPSIATLPDEPLSTDQAIEFASLYCSPVSDAIEAATEKVGMARYVRLNYHLVDRKLELIAIALDRSPRRLARVRDDRRLLPPEAPSEAANDLLSYLIGAAFGRWDLRIGRDPSLAVAAPGPSGPLLICPPGMLVGDDGLPALATPDGYPIELPVGGLLVDEPGHRWDIETAVLRCAAACLDDSAAIVSELLSILGRDSVRDCVRKQFFKDHLTRYSRSRRKAPIYWPLTVPSKKWGVWLYAPMLTRETLFAIAGEAGRRERLASEAVVRLQREQQNLGTGRAARVVAEDLDSEEKLAEELRRFRVEAERIAGLGWEPDLDDGIVLCAAPLADLFPSWPDTKVARSELRNGMYPWANVAAWAEQL
ncbi:MAG: Eco57I restriction-modification methylase domain-containing protein [Gaiella sp.]